MGKYCDNCGHELKTGAKFCPQCGQKVIVVEKVTAIQETDEWKDIYQKTYRKAYAVAFQIMKNKEDAQDILQEAYISAFKNIDLLKDKEKIGAWVNQIVANRCKDWLRKKNPALFSDMVSEDVDLEYEDSLVNENQEFMPEESIDYEDTKKIMQNILDSLPEEQRLCILMYYYEELSVGEIAEALECSTGTVKSRLNYARKYIKTKVEELEKQGTKLYGIAPIPFIVWMLSLKENSTEVEASELAGWNKLNKTMNGQNDYKNVMKDNSQIPNHKKAGNVAEKYVAKAGAKHIAAKAIAGTLVAAVAIGGGYQAAKSKPAEKKEKTKTSVASILKPVNKEDKKKKELDALMEKVDYDYLEKVCTYLPADTAMNEITAEELTSIYSEAFAYYFEDHYCQTYHGSSEYVDTYGEAEHGTNDFYSPHDREIIGDDQEVSEDNKTLTFKKTAFDQFNEITGISADPTSMNLSYIDYDGENYIAHMGDGIDNIIECTVLDKGLDYENNKIIVRLEKKELNSDAEDGEIRTYQSMEISPADNSYGYQIDMVSSSKEKLEKNKAVIAEDLKNNSDKLLRMAVILGSYDPKNDEDKESTMTTLADGAAYTWSTESDIEYPVKNYFIEACELIGISDQDAEKGYTDKIADLAGENLQEYRSIPFSSTAIFYLRTETDEKSDSAKVYFLKRDAIGDGSFDNFQKGTISVKPAYNGFGYEIDNITMEEWNDGYSADLTDIERTASEKADYGDSPIARDITSAVNQSENYWEEQVENLLERIEAKYPKEKENIKKNQEEFQKSIDEEIEKANEENERNGMMGTSLMSPGRVAPTAIKLNRMQERAYFLVGNFLMDNKIEILK